MSLLITGKLSALKQKRTSFTGSTGNMVVRKMDKETMKKFCSEKIKNFVEPWTRDGFTYATNGHILIRVPALPDVPDNPGAPGISKTFAMFNISEESFDIPVLPAPQYSVCEECEGKGKGFTCPECDGRGVVLWETNRHEYEADCLECDGDGIVNGNCPGCGGTGKRIERFGFKINGVSFDRDCLALLKNLPEIKIYPQPINTKVYSQSASSFTFDGGDGLIMPRNE